MIRAVIPLKSPRDIVFQALARFEEYPAWLPGCERAKVLSGGGPEGVSELNLVIQAMGRMEMVLRVDAVLNRALTFHLVRSADLRAYSSAYRLMDASQGGGTVVMSELEIDGGPLAPRFLVERMARKALADTGDALRNHLGRLPAASNGEAGGTSRRRGLNAASLGAGGSRRLLAVWKRRNGEFEVEDRRGVPELH